MVAAVTFAEVAAVFLNGILEVLFHGACGNAESFSDFGMRHAFDAAHIENVAGALWEVVREVEDGTDIKGWSSLFRAYGDVLFKSEIAVLFKIGGRDDFPRR